MEPNLWCIMGQDFVSNLFNENQKMMINQDYWENLCMEKIINTRKFALNVLNILQTVISPIKFSISKAILKIRAICHAWDLQKLAQSCKQLHLLCPPDPLNLPGTVLLNGFQSSWGALKSIVQDSTSCM